MFRAGVQVPVIPLVEIVGKADKLPPEQIGVTALNVGVTFGFTVIVTSSEQLESEAVHLNIFAPIESPDTEDVGLVEFEKEPVPEIIDQVPVAGDEAANVVDVILHKL